MDRARLERVSVKHEELVAHRARGLHTRLALGRHNRADVRAKNRRGSAQPTKAFGPQTERRSALLHLDYICYESIHLRSCVGDRNHN